MGSFAVVGAHRSVLYVGVWSWKTTRVSNGFDCLFRLLYVCDVLGAKEKVFFRAKRKRFDYSNMLLSMITFSIYLISLSVSGISLYVATFHDM